MDSDRLKTKIKNDNVFYVFHKVDLFFFFYIYIVQFYVKRSFVIGDCKNYSDYILNPVKKTDFHHKNRENFQTVQRLFQICSMPQMKKYKKCYNCI